jgi:hypothetical protein
LEEEKEMDYFELLNLACKGTLNSQNGDKRSKDFCVLYSAECDWKEKG